MSPLRQPVPTDAFLNVERSALGRRWVPRLGLAGSNVATALAQRSGLPDVVARVLAGRGVTDAAATEVFLTPRLRDLMPDPDTMTDCGKAATRMAAAVRRRERVAVFGDYDVDGAASSAIVARVLRALGCDVEIYIPDRITEGYGPTVRAMEALADRGASLIVTVDCGVMSHEAIYAANARGLDCVVLDHHQTGPELPNAVAVVDPNRQDDLSGLGHLCAAGVAFMVMVSLRRVLAREDFPDLMAMLDIVALATVCDVVPLVGLNRAFVVQGLRVMARGTNPGITALRRVAGLNGPPDATSLGFALGPRINAGGRVGDASLGARLLCETDPDEAESIAAVLDGFNRERQAVEAEVLRAAMEEATREARGTVPPVIVTASDGWHPGVVGLVASRLKERFDRPAFAIGFDGSGRGTGSGRSVPALDIGTMVRGAVAEGLLEKGGGHAMAAGLTVRRERLGELRAHFERHAARTISADHVAELEIDAALSASGATADLVTMLERAGPYGAGHARPRFAVPDHLVAEARVVGRGHVMARLSAPEGSKLRVVAFRAADTPVGAALLERVGRRSHVVGTLERDDYRGQRATVLHVEDAAEA